MFDQTDHQWNPWNPKVEITLIWMEAHRCRRKSSKERLSCSRLLRCWSCRMAWVVLWLITDVVELDFSHENISISFRETQPSKRPTKPSNDKAVSSFAIQRRKFSPPSTWCHQSASATRKMTNRKIKDWRRANHNATSDLWHFSLTQNLSRKIHARKSSKPMSCGCRFAISQWRRAVDCRWVEIVQSIYCYKCQFMLMSCRCREDCSTEFMASRCDTHHLHTVRYISHVEAWVFTADMRGFS